LFHREETFFTPDLKPLALELVLTFAQVGWELDDLEKVFRNYGFETNRWLIPSKNSHLKLMSKVVDVVEENDGSGNLVIVYYAGHAGINSSRGATWTWYLRFQLRIFRANK
tara:strand:- start:392 stop:724 length:333 start_codon:yes stop_codon:yes gene_type:complete